MNILKSIKAGVLIFALYATAISVLANVLVPFLPSGNKYVGYGIQATAYVILAVLTYYVIKWYFAGNNPGYVNGGIIGVITIVINIILSLTQAVPVIVMQGMNDAVLNAFKMFFIHNVDLWISSAVILITSIYVGYKLHHKQMQACNVKDAVGTCMPEEAQHVD